MTSPINPSIAPRQAATVCRICENSAPSSRDLSMESTCPLMRRIRFRSFFLSRMTCANGTTLLFPLIIYPGRYICQRQDSKDRMPSPPSNPAPDEAPGHRHLRLPRGMRSRGLGLAKQDERKAASAAERIRGTLIRSLSFSLRDTSSAPAVARTICTRTGSDVNWPSNAHFVERRIVGRTAEQRGDDGAGARPLKSSFQRSAISFQLSPERDALGRPGTTRHAPPRREPARREGARSEIADAMRPVTTPNAPAYSRAGGDRRLQRESARTALIGERRHRGPVWRTAEEHGEDGAGAQGPARSGARAPAGPDAESNFALFTRAMPGGQFRRQPPVARPPRADARSAALFLSLFTVPESSVRYIIMLNWPDVLNLAKTGNPAPDRKVIKTDAEWRQQLGPGKYRVTRQAGTERPFSSQMCGLFEPGIYSCLCCETVLFDASEKFESGTGWPSFTQPVAVNAIAYRFDGPAFLKRVETICNTCDAHLGHVFPDGPPPSGLRYCMNAVALKKASAS